MKRSALGAASAERAGIMSERSVLLRVAIVGRLGQRPSVDVDVGAGHRAGLLSSSTDGQYQIFSI